MTTKASNGTYHATLRVLTHAVTAAERGLPMPKTEDMAADMGCGAPNVTMAVTRLVKAGVLRRLNSQGKRLRLLVVQTGAATAEA